MKLRRAYRDVAIDALTFVAGDRLHVEEASGRYPRAANHGTIQIGNS